MVAQLQLKLLVLLVVATFKLELALLHLPMAERP
jgi:hypothetical protein